MLQWRGTPLLIGLGPIRSGSTWLFELLVGHSEVAVTRRKEIDFFSTRYDKGLDWYRRQFQSATAKTRLFADISPSYILTDAALARIRQSISEPLFVVGLRSPYARVLSWYLAYVQKPDGNDSQGMAELRAYGENIGVVAPAIKRYVAEFRADRIIYFEHDGLKRSPEESAASLQQALGLTLQQPPSIRHVVNGSKHEYRLLLNHPVVLACARVMRGWAPKLTYDLKYGPLHRLIHGQRLTWEPPYDAIIDGMRRFQSSFERDISELEVLLARDLSHWRFDRQIQELQLGMRTKNSIGGEADAGSIATTRTVFDANSASNG